MEEKKEKEDEEEEEGRRKRKRKKKMNLPCTQEKTLLPQFSFCVFVF